MSTGNPPLGPEQLADLVTSAQWLVRQWGCECSYRATAARKRGDRAFAVACEAQAETALATADALRGLLTRAPIIGQHRERRQALDRLLLFGSPSGVVERPLPALQPVDQIPHARRAGEHRRSA